MLLIWIPVADCRKIDRKPLIDGSDRIAKSVAETPCSVHGSMQLGDSCANPRRV